MSKMKELFYSQIEDPAYVLSRIESLQNSRGRLIISLMHIKKALENNESKECLLEGINIVLQEVEKENGGK